ncbi:hypothetical protein KXW98_001514 [Aspergillus fumigatus]|uniref:Uncharacterized protein n=1 Tax=Aspergillus fumigatus TaxID=746128 RepID=A0A229Y2Y4_ASPFM|nr:hypothetical protein KXX45_003106 [Aspergillus fumigatus]KAH1283473.1 hypothetical protein KXX30_001677 [Aspergillus fumigatus]KAH1284576.1 hypothetical protein KXX48_001648 [Aspergillus fumigatus]KAH1301627.1 hypothetical protein KXX11_003718 [Aspergillus fumigatus]KAH1307785.1 hypothetical protein KXX66_002053 [Aspergillus fumigatus]
MAESKIDPRIFPRWVRYSALLTVNVFVFMGNMYSSGIATGFGSLAEDLQLPFEKLSDLISYSVLAMGLANIFWMPLALCFGKRPVVLISMAMFVTGIIWTCVAKNYNSLMGARVFASFGYGSIESLGPNLFYERNYASAMATYALFLSGGSQIGPVIAGYLVASNGWRWFFYLCLIFAAVNFVTTFFLLPETLYEAETATEDEPQGDLEKVSQRHIATVPSRSTSDSFGYAAYWKGLFKVGISQAAREEGVLKFLGYTFALPLPLIVIPGVLLASVMYGVVLGGVVSISTLCPSLLSPPPYLFTSADLGLFTLSSFIGIIIAFPIAGPLTDYVSQWLRRRNNNIHKPEHRFPALLVPFLLCPPGLIIFGYSFAHQRHYIGPAAGAALSAASLTLVPSVMLSYVVDSYPRTSGEALVLVNASKNVVAFGLAKGSYSWMALVGVDKMFYEFAGIQWAVIALALPLYYAGPWIRAKTTNFV